MRTETHVDHRRWELITILTMNQLHQMKLDVIMMMMKWMLGNLLSFLCGEI